MHKLRLFFINNFSLDQDKASNDEIYKMMKNCATLRGTNLFILMMAIFIASIGLNMNSTAVIIGAMLISPLMGGIMAIGYGMATNDMKLVQRAGKVLIVQIIICILTSALYFKISPMSIAKSELLARTTPTIWDVLIAFFGGLAGIVGVTRKEKSNVIPGVAIATALMPPLCTVGYGIAIGNPKFYLGAFYLFFINSFFICLSTYLIIRIIGIPLKTYVGDDGVERVAKVKKLTIFIAILTVVPSLLFGYQFVVESVLESNINKYVDKEFIFDQTRVVSKYVDKKNNVLEIALVGSRISSDTIELLDNKLAEYNLGSYQLKVTQGEANQSLGSDDIKTIIQQELYEKNEIALSDRDRRIEILENELMKYKLAEFDIKTLTKEISSIFPQIKSLSMGKNKIYNNQTDEIEEVIIASVIGQDPFTTDDKNKITAWIIARTNNTNVQVYMDILDEPILSTDDEQLNEALGEDNE
ncbi:MAG: TIGR00341 family protein [Turicibacter sp.]